MKKLSCILLPIVLLFLTACTPNHKGANVESVVTAESSVETEMIISESQTKPAAQAEPVTQTELVTEVQTELVSSNMTIHFLDVGQGLAILVQSNDQTLIYDGGDKSTSSFVVAYLKEQGIEKIDYLISSHYDSDHVAGLIGCLNVFDIGTVIGSNYEYNSNLYSSFVSTVQEKELSITFPAVGTQYPFGSGSFTILSPSVIGSDSNANSLAIMLVNGENRFLFTGDAEHSSEAQMISLGLDLECDVLSIGHHGSASSTSYDFLQYTVPEFAVISCGADNQYGHPDKDTMEKLNTMDVLVYRSDKQGTVVAYSDGTTLTWSQEPCNDYSPGFETDLGTLPEDEAIIETVPEAVEEPVQIEEPLPQEQAIEEYVWKSATGAKYHSISNCGNMNPDKATQITLDQAETIGLGRCSKCW